MKTIGGVISFETGPKMHFGTRNNKFSDDKISFEDERYAICFDGVLLNSTQLKAALGCSKQHDLIIALYEKFGAELVFEAKGTYALSLWDKQKNTVLITNDLLSKRSLFYRISAEGTCYAGSYYELLDSLAQTDYVPQVNETAVEDMMECGFFHGNSTYLEDVFYLAPFESLCVDLDSHTAQVISHEMRNMQVPEDEEEAIDAFDALFQKAIDLQFRKNEEYGYRQLVTLSGGMDSRACLLKGLSCGYNKDVVCFNYAQSGSLDFQISQQIANDHRLDYLFYPMDAALFLERLDDAMLCNECQQPATGSTAANTMSKLLNIEVFGIVNGGLCGGELLGDLVKETVSAQGGEMKKVSRNKLVKAFKLLKNKKVDATRLALDKEALFDQVRACQNFIFMFLDHYETLSPFLDEDVFMFVTQVKPQYLLQRNFYTKWMMKYIPNDYIVTHTCCPLNASKLRIVATKTRYAFQQKLTGNSIKEMNPFNYWFNNRLEFREMFMKDYETLCANLEAHKGAEATVRLARDKWDEKRWRKNSFLLTALHGVEGIYKKFI